MGGARKTTIHARKQQQLISVLCTPTGLNASLFSFRLCIEWIAIRLIAAGFARVKWMALKAVVDWPISTLNSHWIYSMEIQWKANLFKTFQIDIFNWKISIKYISKSTTPWSVFHSFYFIHSKMCCKNYDREKYSFNIFI